MKKSLFILLLLLIPNIVFAASDDWESNVICIYQNKYYDSMNSVWRTKQDSLVLNYKMDYFQYNNIVDIYSLELRNKNTLIYKAANGISFPDGTGYDWTTFHFNRQSDADNDASKYPGMIKNNEYCPSAIYKYYATSGSGNAKYYICNNEELVLEGRKYVTKNTCTDINSYLAENQKTGYTYTKYNLQNDYKYSMVHYDNYNSLYDINDQITRDISKINGTSLEHYHQQNVLKFVRDSLIENLANINLGANTWDQYTSKKNKDNISNEFNASEESLFECTYEGNASKNVKPVKLQKTTNGTWVAYLYNGDESKPAVMSEKWIRAENYINYKGNNVVFKTDYITLDSNTQRCPHYVYYYKDYLNIEGGKDDFTFTPADSKPASVYGEYMGTYSPDDENELEPPEEGHKDCESLLGHPEEKGSPAYYLVFIFDVMKYVAIIILIVFTVMDLVAAVPSHDSDIINKSLQKAFKRLIICVVIFVLPTLISFLLSIIDKIPNDLCGIK